MQLAEQGKLDLRADVNRYLDFQIPATYPQPITLANLRAHTADSRTSTRRCWSKTRPRCARCATS
jgi:CubicO group peptidase (beta-lactamase class C family)